MAMQDETSVERADDPHVKASRLPALPVPLDPIVAQLFEDTRARGGHILNLHKTNGHAPKLARAKRPFVSALRNDCQVARIYRELAICRTAINVECAYELHHHHPLALKAGLSEMQFEALANWRKETGLFNEALLAVLAYVDEMALQKGSVSDATFTELSKHFNAQEIVELTYCATSYYASGLYMKALGVLPDEPHKKAAPGKF